MNRRVALLESLLEAQYPGNPPPDLCVALDQAVEFAVCDGRSIAEAIGAFFAEDDWGPAQKTLEEIVRPGVQFRPSALPIMPKAVSNLLRLTEDSATVDELERIASTDPVLAARLLAASNSARHGSRFQIVRLREAVMRLGVLEARRALIASSLGGLFASATLRELWEHSQIVADSSARIATTCGIDPETAWLAGLLHDIGRLGFATLPADARIAERRWLEAGFPLVYAETLAFGNDHAGLGGELLRSWEIPDLVGDAVAMHHRPEAARSDLEAILFLAEDTPVRLGLCAAEDLWLEMRRRIACERAGLELDELREMDSSLEEGHFRAIA